MGTTADFFIKTYRDPYEREAYKLTWIGSCNGDGYPEGIPPKVLRAKSKKSFKQRVLRFLSEHQDALTYKQREPWWTLGRAEYVYMFEERIHGQVWIISGYRTIECVGARTYDVQDQGFIPKSIVEVRGPKR